MQHKAWWNTDKALISGRKIAQKQPVPKCTLCITTAVKIYSEFIPPNFKAYSTIFVNCGVGKHLFSSKSLQCSQAWQFSLVPLSFPFHAQQSDVLSPVVKPTLLFYILRLCKCISFNSTCRKEKWFQSEPISCGVSFGTLFQIHSSKASLNCLLSSGMVQHQKPMGQYLKSRLMPRIWYSLTSFYHGPPIQSKHLAGLQVGSVLLLLDVWTWWS